MPTTVSGSYPAVNSDSDATINGLTVGRGTGAIATNTAVGANALRTNTTGSLNATFGAGAGELITTGSANSYFGCYAGAQVASSTGSNNSALGYFSLGGITTGVFNTAIGQSALQANTTASYNTAVGGEALKANTTATFNCAVGFQSLRDNTTGANNIAIGGYQALIVNTTGSQNTAVGTGSLAANTTASNNTAVGYQAGYSNTTGTGMTFVGNAAGYTSTTGNNSTYLGASAGSVATASNNTFVGTSAGESVTSGASNTILGRYNGNQGGIDIRTLSNRIVLSDGNGNPRFVIDNAGNIFAPAVNFTVANVAGFAAFGSGAAGFLTIDSRIIPRKPNDPGSASDNQIDLGDGGSRYKTIYAGTGTINTSDGTEKQQVRDLNAAEKAVSTRIKGLIKAYKFNDAVALKGDNARIHIGVIAQEVAAAFEAEGLDAYKYSMFCSDTWYEVNGNTIDDQNKFVTKDTPNAVARTRLGIRYDELLAFVISTL